jgi:hypothetical protein
VITRYRSNHTVEVSNYTHNVSKFVFKHIMKIKPRWITLRNVVRSLMPSRVRNSLCSRRGYTRSADVTKTTGCKMHTNMTSVDTGLNLTQDVIPLLYRLLCQSDDPTIDTNLTSSNMRIVYGDPVRCTEDGVKYVYIYCTGVEKLLYEQCIDMFGQLTPFLRDIRVLSSSDTHAATVVLKVKVTESENMTPDRVRVSNTQTTDITCSAWPMLVRVGLDLVQPSIERLQTSEGTTVFSRLDPTDQLIVVNLMNLLEVLLGTLVPHNPHTLSCGVLPTCAPSFNIENTINIDNERDTLGTLKLSCTAIFDMSVKDISSLIHASTTHIEKVWFDLVQSTLVVEWRAYGAPITSCWLSAGFIGGGGVVKGNNSSKPSFFPKLGVTDKVESPPLHTWDPPSYPVHM